LALPNPLTENKVLQAVEEDTDPETDPEYTCRASCCYDVQYRIPEKAGGEPDPGRGEDAASTDPML
jgi:hypothetical protein